MTSLPRLAVELHLSADGVVEIWRAGELLGQIRVSGASIEFTLGDVEPAAGAVVRWPGEPLRLSVELPPRETC